MKIVIPSRARVDTILKGTLSKIPDEWLQQTIVFVPEDELVEYADELAEMQQSKGVEVVGLEYEGIAQKRQLMAEWVDDDKIVMIDDDVDFLVRKTADDWRLEAADDYNAKKMFDMIEMLLNDYAQVAISSREGNNRAGVGSPMDLVRENERAMRITAYRTKDFLECEHGRVPVMEDMDITLQLLRKGLKNCVLYYWANGQKMTNAPGGCSVWRTLDIHNATAEKMAELHPGFVRVRLKENKTDREGFGTRKEITVQWKKAYASSQK